MTCTTGFVHEIKGRQLHDALLLSARAAVEAVNWDEVTQDETPTPALTVVAS